MATPATVTFLSCRFLGDVFVGIHRVRLFISTKGLKNTLYSNCIFLDIWEKKYCMKSAWQQRQREMEGKRGYRSVYIHIKSLF